MKSYAGSCLALALTALALVAPVARAAGPAARGPAGAPGAASVAHGASPAGRQTETRGRPPSLSAPVAHARVGPAAPGASAPTRALSGTLVTLGGAASRATKGGSSINGTRVGARR